MALGGVNTNFSGSALLNLSLQQQALTLANNQASSGNRITNASVDPSGVAIYAQLTSQSQGADQANENITDAQNAVNVAQGGLTTIQSGLDQISNLAIEANNGFNSASDNQALNNAAQQLTQQINQTAGGINFNGTTLLAGGLSGNTPATQATANVTNNDQVNNGGGVLTSVTSSAATTNGTFNVQVANTGAGAVANVTYTDSATQTTVNVGQFAANSSTTVNGTTLNFGNFTTSDTGASATVQTTAATAGQSNPNIGVQSGPNAGQTINVNIPNATTAGLGIQNVDLTNAASATNTEGQIANAITSVNLASAQLGAESAGLQNAFNNNNILSNNLTASASAIGDVNEGQVSTQLGLLNTQQQISIDTLNSANNLYGYLNTFSIAA
jgi:flagellin